MLAIGESASAGAGALTAEQQERMLFDELPQVRYIARRIHERLPRHIAIEDLVHAGVVGLMDALHKYDPGKHVQFSSYAKFRIRGAILDSLRDLDWSPRDLRRKARSIDAARHRLSAQLGRAPIEPELAGELGMSLPDFQALLAEVDGLEIGSLHMRSPLDGKEEDLCEFLPSLPEQTPYFACLGSEMKQLLARIISQLPDRERQVLSLYYYKELTMKEVGTALGIGESRVSQIHSLALLRLKTRLQELMRNQAPPTNGEAGTSGKDWMISPAREAGTQ